MIVIGGIILSERLDKMKKSFTPQVKATVALEAIKGELTIPQIASRYEVHPTQIGRSGKNRP